MRISAVTGFKTVAAAAAALMTMMAMMAAGAAFTACSNDSGGGGASRSGAGADEGDGNLGTAALALQVAPGSNIDSVSYAITGPGGFTRSGSSSVAQSATISIVVGGIPAGTGYMVTLTATSVDGRISCAGSASFSIMARATTAVTVHLTCHEAARTGTVAVNGTINVCPVVDGVSALPAEVVVGSSLALSVVAHDSDAGPAALAFSWTASSGSFSDPASPSPTFTCARPGAATITVTASDGDPAAGCAGSGTVQVTCSIPGAGGPATVSTLAVYGDAPYGTTPTDTQQFLMSPAFIASVNADPDVSLVMHVGDIHSGKQFCTEAYDRSIFDLWTAFADPLIYTPGDNEWSDCHKVAQGGGQYNPMTGQIDFVLDAGGNPVDFANGDPIANLALVRSIFFATPGSSLGVNKKQVFSQAQLFDPAHPTDASYVENVMWEQSRVLFVTIDVPGGSNNDNDIWYGAPTQTPAQAQEIVDRTAADLRWLDLAFAQAAADGVVGVVIQAQADMWDPEKGAAHQAAYEPFVLSVATHTTSLGKPVLMFNGDSHVYLSHNPLSPADALAFMHPGYDVPNFHRVVVHGSTLPLEWLRLTVNPQANAPEGPNAIGPFSWQRVIFP